MKIKRFYSSSMRGALKQVTDTFGEDAAILSSQKTSSGVEVIAALDYDEDLLPERMLTQMPEDEAHSETAQYAQASQSTDVESRAIDKNRSPSLSNTDISTVDAKEHGVNTEHNVQNSAVVNNHGQNEPSRVVNASTNSAKLSSQFNIETHVPPASKSKYDIEWSTDPGLLAMRDELNMMRTMMSEQLRGIGWKRFIEQEPTKAMLVRKASNLGLKNSTVEALVAKVKIQNDPECSWQNLLALLAKSIPVEQNNLIKDGGVFALLGPTGAGKTTSIAKLAARFVIKHGQDSVGLISIDDYRVSGQQQLARIGKLLGVPMAAVSKKFPLESLLKQFQNKKLVLIDTAGMGQGDKEIAPQLESLIKSKINIKRLLLLPATNQFNVLRQSIQLFEPFKPFNTMVTKLDEATSLGEVLSLIVEQGLTVDFTTDGQKIPDDIRVARSHHLVAKAVWLANKYTLDHDDWELAQNHSDSQCA